MSHAKIYDYRLVPKEGFTLNRVPTSGEETEFVEGFRYGRTREGFTLNRVDLEDEEEFVEGFTYGRTLMPPTSRYATYRSFFENGVEQLPALRNTTLGSCTFNCNSGCYKTRGGTTNAPFAACGDMVVGCPLTDPMYRVATTHELNSCAAPTTAVSMEPVSLKRPCDPFSVGFKSYPLLTPQTYQDLTHSLYSPALPTRNAK